MIPKFIEIHPFQDGGSHGCLLCGQPKETHAPEVIQALREEIERLKAEVKKLNSECPGCGQIADGWGFCDCAHDFKKEKSGQLRELFSEAVKVLERIANDDACAEHDAREFLAKAKT